MRKITDVKRQKDIYNLSVAEFRKGDWLEMLPKDNDMYEVSFKSNYLTISSAKIKKLEE